MRLMAPGETAPAEVKKYLLPHEEQLITVRRHPALLMGPALLTLGGLIAAVVLSDTVLKSQAWLVYLVWIGWGIVLVRLIWKAMGWAADYFVVTSQRMMLTSGVLTRRMAMMPLAKVTDMSFERSFWGRLFGYGGFILESAGQDQALRVVDHIPYPEQLYLEVCNLIFPSRDHGDD